ncbi:uncharacterized protein LOC143212753 isoform X1 [Lasioglossum baleicum]|uniref:uncharacterized protein LOC143212753 isoform X1 n=1 Tax=Lasioglossum baleicum TaxID=434251 RepID=UPI003FCED4C0
MDILPTQVYEDDDSFTPTHQLSHFVPHNIKEKHIGSLRIGSITYPIEQGITKIGRHPECDIVLNDQARRVYRNGLQTFRPSDLIFWSTWRNLGFMTLANAIGTVDEVFEEQLHYAILN